MKPIAVFIAVAVTLGAAPLSHAKTVTMPAKHPNEQSVNGVAGPTPKKVVNTDKPSAQPSKATLKKTKIKPPPPMHDPN